MAQLPIHDVLPELLAALSERSSAVLIAPPGAGKTTAVAPALIRQSWCDGMVIMLAPRRLAARSAAERMAEMLGEKAGETVGYLTRMDSKRSSATRILLMTEAIFVSTILEDAELPGVSAIVFDEAHERHLDSDLGLALALESQSVLRENLRILVMSATLDGARFAGLLGADTPVIESAGKAWPLTLRWLGARPELRVDEAMASAILTAWREEGGDILAFLPGVAEIERVLARLQPRLPATPILPLHGQSSVHAQQTAIHRDQQGRRRIVLATAIAESSLTLDGVSVVVDSGLARRAQFDPASGSNRLITTRASQASAEQRAGRAARQGPGVAYRLWEEHAHAGRPAFDPAEILESDLAPLVLTLLQWGTADPATLNWLDPPPSSALLVARERLQTLGAIDEDGQITPFGRRLARLPMAPAHAAMLLFGAQHGAALNAAQLVLLLQERGLGGRGEDLSLRLARWQADRSPRAKAAHNLARRFARMADRLVAETPADPAVLHDGGRHITGDATPSAEPSLGVLLAAGLPGNIACKRGAAGTDWHSASGRGYRLDETSPLASGDWLVIGDAQGQAKSARIMAACPLSADEIEQWFPASLSRHRTVRWNGKEERVEARIERRLGAITLATGPDAEPDKQAVLRVLLEQARKNISDLLPAALMARAAHAGITELSTDHLRDTLADWLAPLLENRRDLALAQSKFADAVLTNLDWNTRKELDRLAPSEFISPAGTRHAIDYAHTGGPAIHVRVQALFGLDSHPMAGRVPLTLLLTSPAGRPIQTTRDLPGFWRGSWRDVAKEMKGRYPKHRWPEQPWLEQPGLQTSKAFERR